MLLLLLLLLLLVLLLPLSPSPSRKNSWTLPHRRMLSALTASITAMKTTTLSAAVLIAALNALTLVPSLQPYASYCIAASLALALWLALKTLLAPSPIPAPALAPNLAPPPPPPPPAPTVEIRNLAEADAIALLATFQAKGRLVDFLMDDIAAYSDAQVGAAARVVQQGCKAALQQHFTIAPVANAAEGSRILVPADAPAGEYSLVGKVAGEPPFTGTLVHKGWKATSVKLPRSLPTSSGQLPPIAPAQVELR